MHACDLPLYKERFPDTVTFWGIRTSAYEIQGHTTHPGTPSWRLCSRTPHHVLLATSCGRGHRNGGKGCPEESLSIDMDFKVGSTLWNSSSSPATLSEKAMAPHSSTLAWQIAWMEEPGRLQSMGSLRVRHDWAASLSLFTCMHWRRKWQPTPVFLPGESQGRGSLVGCRLWGCTGSDTTETT